MVWLLQLFRRGGLLPLSRLRLFQFLCREPLYSLLLRLRLASFFAASLFSCLCSALSLVASILRWLAVSGCLRNWLAVSETLMLWPARFHWKTACAGFTLDWVGGLWWGSSAHFTAWCMAFQPMHSIECGSAELTSDYNIPQTVCARWSFRIFAVVYTTEHFRH